MDEPAKGHAQHAQGQEVLTGAVCDNIHVYVYGSRQFVWGHSVLTVG